MVVRKELVRIQVGQPAEFIDIFYVADMAGIDLAGGNSRINAFVVLSVVKARQKDIAGMK